ncbi:TVP38/TMEM64 family protein [Jannaschia helgolandensis]|uniref:TVP38/TMEM64 family protein n=1 Tax=Jannaschia helgolandensis TaxID=188906 RepID=UPI0030DC3BD2|tara:strand:- start:4389 stop:5159 length:771 start_codon:yes stop_codon:yes gene_type:complete
MPYPSPSPAATPIKAWHIWLWPVLLVVIALGMWLLPWGDWVPILRDWVKSHGTYGIVVFVLAYVVVVILPLPAAAMSVVGGLAFGWWGYPLSMLGSILGAIPPFLIGRHWLRAPLMRRIDGPRVRAADRAIAQNSLVFVVLLRLTPILPFTAQNWLLGFTAVRPWTYLLATTAGLAPGTLAMVWIGEMGGLATVGASRAQLMLGGGGLLAFGLMVIWLGRVATREMRRAGFHKTGAVQPLVDPALRPESKPTLTDN